jgi:hypothetical protein
MKHTLFNCASWVISDPRRAFVVLSVIMVVLTLAFAALPVDVALAEDIIGRS